MGSLAAEFCSDWIAVYRAAKEPKRDDGEAESCRR